MSEYWKSTPKYWCKFCEAFVKDTKFEKQQHDATPRHQGNIQRSLRRLHKDNEREERDKDRAKAEVARLNGIVSGSGGSSASGHVVAQSTSGPAKKATVDDRKRQLKQLADLGVAVPEAYRREVAMAGDWETVSVRQIKKEEDVKPDVLSFGTHKRKFEGQEEEEEAGTTVVRKGWGSTTKRYPGTSGAVEDIESLLRPGNGNVIAKMEDVPQIKKEDTDEASEAPATDASARAVIEGEVKQEENAIAEAPVVFKKRKAKVMK